MATAHEEFDMKDLIREANTRWLRPAEVFFILHNYRQFTLSQDPPDRPRSGSLFLFDRNVLRFFRKDGHNWRKKNDGKTVKEAHERLKVQNADALQCYYAHGEENPKFQRRSYWMLDATYENIVLVHYRDVSEYSQGRANSTIVQNLCNEVLLVDHSRRGSYPQIQSVSDQSDFSGAHHSDGNPGIGMPEEVGSNIVTGIDKADSDNNLDMNEVSDFSTSCSLGTYSHDDPSYNFQQIREKLDIDDSTPYNFQQIREKLDIDDSTPYNFQQISEKLDIDDSTTVSGLKLSTDNVSNLAMVRTAALQYHYQLQDQQLRENFQKLIPNTQSWNEMLEHSAVLPQRNITPSFTNIQNTTSLPGSCITGPSNLDSTYPFQKREGILPSMFSEQYQNRNFHLEQMISGAGDISIWNRPAEGRTQETGKAQIESFLNCQDNNNNEKINRSINSTCEHAEKLLKSDSFGWLLDEHTYPNEMVSKEPVEHFTVAAAESQGFKIYEVVPEWAYASEGSKIVIFGNFIGEPLGQTWCCMFGDAEVPAEVVCNGVLRCKAPPHAPGKVPFYVTPGNCEPCSEIREFQYHMKPGTVKNSQEAECVPHENDELMLQLRFAHVLISGINSKISPDVHAKELVADDQWEQIEYAIKAGITSDQQIKEWLLEIFLKEKLHQWLEIKCNEGGKGALVLDKHGQGVLHLAAALGYDWALNPILKAGVGINFRDVHGWTALHWAAKFGREKTVTALIAADAFSSAVTDPTTTNPRGKTAAAIAAASGHGGIAGYLAEASLTSHLCSLTLEEAEVSKAADAGEEDKVVESISERSLTHQIPGMTEDELCSKDSMAAIMNAAQAATRIQAAFRLHSFRKRMQKSSYVVDEYGLTSEEMTKAATRIQSKYRGQKDRREFLNLRQKAVKIQAHVRGYQARNKYKRILWAVGCMEKAVLRWRRGGKGLRGFKGEVTEHNKNREVEDYDEILRSYRRKDLEDGLTEQVGCVFHLSNSPRAQQQYRRMLEFQQVKGQHETATDQSLAAIGESSASANIDSWDEWYNTCQDIMNLQE